MIPPPIGKRGKPKIERRIDRNGSSAQRRRVYCPGCETVASVIVENAESPCRVCGGAVELRYRGRPRKVAV